MFFNNYINYFLLLLSLNPFCIKSQDYDFVNYPDNKAVSEAYIYTLSRDSLGYIWVGTGEGLIRFDGKSFKIYTTEDSLSDNFISSGINDGMYMWFGHMNGTVSFYNGKVFTKFAINAGDQGPVTCFGKDGDGKVWMSNYSGQFVKLDYKGIAERLSIKSSESVLSFQFAEESRILIGTGSGLVLSEINSPGEIIETKKFAETVGTQIVKIIKKVSGDGYYAASSNDGIFVLNNEMEITGRIQGFTGVQTIYEDHNKILWIATFGKGLVSIDEQGKRSEFKKYTGENVKAVFAGFDGNIWIGGYGSGLTRISNRVFRVMKFEDDLYGSDVTAICHDERHAWIGTEKGLIKTDLNGNVSYFNSSINNKITSICQDITGNLWIGTESDGLYILDGSARLNKFHISTGSLEKSVTSLTQTDNFLWVGTKKGICRIGLSDFQIKWYTIGSGLPHNSINGLHADSSGRVWISSRSNILAYIIDESVKRQSINSGSSALSFSYFETDERSFLWAGSLGNGLYRITGDSLVVIASQNGLYSDYCHGVITDQSGHIWVVHQDALSRVNIGNFFVRAFNHFDQAQEKFIFNVNPASRDAEGKIWLGTQKGLIIIDQTKETRDIPLVPEILSIKINNEEFEFSKGRIVLKPGKYNIEIVFNAVSQKEPELVTYKVFMEGYDQEVELTRLNSIVYRNISAGTYKFTLSALNGDGLSSKIPANVEIIIHTPLTKQWWFYVVLVVFAAMISILYIKRREYIFRIERKKLEEKVFERTREIQEQKNEIEIQRDLIKAKNGEITASIRYALEIQNAVLPSLSTIDRYFPENFIFLRPKDIVSGDFYWIARKSDKLVFTVGDCTGHGVPGAFMSLLSITILNEIVNIEGITEADKIVNRLHSMIHKSLNRGRADGLDMALCVYDWNQRRIQFTGAMNNLVYIRNGELNLLKADKYSVNMVPEEFNSFSLHELDLQKGDIIYLYSDGYMDQFGGQNDKKFSIRQFYNTLVEIHQFPMHEQEAILEHRHTEWKNEKVQTDDITVMGIRF
jgi:ligand-binding sensor domain-containing protein/serine phosphatase RsbU (regulator of sigma subunit)